MKKYTGLLNAAIFAVLALNMNTFAQDATLSNRVAELEARLLKLDTSNENELTGYWKNGFVLEDKDKNFKLQLGGRIHVDTAFFSADDELEEAVGEFNDGVKFRRARLYMRGNIYTKSEFAIEYDFSGSGSFQSVYMGLKEIPVIGSIRAGHLIEPMGLEEVASNNHITFMERGTATAINPVFNTGILAFNAVADQRVTWAAGVFKETGEFGDSVSNETWAATVRLTGLPYYADDGKTYLHLGSSISLRDIDEQSYRIRSRPQSSVAPYVVDTKSMPADSINLYGMEALLTIQSLSLQSEWIMSSVDRLPGEDGIEVEDTDFTSYYFMASYFLTGEFRPYLKSSGYFGRVTPNQNATGKNWGSGAWEIAARYDVIDLSDADIEGGELETYTLGLNWYLNPHMRIMWNYVAADVKDTGNADIFEMRFQIDI